MRIGAIESIEGGGFYSFDSLFDIVDGRMSDEEITLMKNNCGMGLQFAVTAQAIYERAEKQDVCRDLLLEWFITRKNGDEWSL